MNKKIGQFALPVLLFAFVGTAQAAPQEDIYFGQWGSVFFETTYNKVYYQDVTVLVDSDGGFKSMAGALPDAKWLATNVYEDSPITFTSKKGLFDLNAMWLAGAWGSQKLTITGYANGVEIYSIIVDVTTTATQFDFTGFQGIDKFNIASTGSYTPTLGLADSSANWVLGNVTVTQAVPEPEAYAMLLAGLGLVGVMARRRQRK
ncbi:MAG: FxDxF family PEP-CTERM protein [Proteobacteria bacterium]|nr:FxDxF family PEP-CTERM protein [Pseudomonadota bacterium]